MSFGSRLKLLREERGLTQQMVADILKVERPTIAGYETKRKQPDYEKISILADYFNVSIDYLLGRSDVRNPYIDIESNKIEKIKNVKKDSEKPKENLPGNKKESSEPKLATTEMVVDKLIKAGLLKDDKIDARIANMLLNSLKIDIELKLKEEERKNGSS